MAKRLPYIITDIDGVLIRGKNVIPRTVEALQLIRKLNLPFCCLTNGGGSVQQVKADKMNAIFKTHFHKDPYFSHSNVILNHTPLKGELVKASKEGLVIITGSLDVEGIVEDLGIRNYATADELYTIFLHQQTEEIRLDAMTSKLTYEMVQHKFKKRGIELPMQTEKIYPLIKAAFILNDVNPYEPSLCVFVNMFTQRVKENQQLPRYYATQNDILYSSTFPLLRMAMGPFTYILKGLLKDYHNISFAPILYGKPNKLAYKFVEEYMKNKYPFGGNFYMIGDNPNSDIKGANDAGWTSIMTRTGVFKGKENDQENPAQVVVQDFHSAIEHILKKEGLSV